MQRNRNIIDMLIIKEVIKDKGYSVTSFAEKIGMKQVSLSRIINGNPTVETLEKIANALDVDVKDLFNSTKTNKEPKEEIQSIINQLENLKEKL